MKIKPSHLLALCVFSLSALSASAAVVTSWTFETNFLATTTSDTTTGPSLAAEVGTGTATGLHASAASDWSSPAGNGVGSLHSYSVNTWAVGDYFQFSTSTVGITEGITVSFDANGSGTGPAAFSLQYNAGAGYVEAGTYTIPSGVSWTTSAYFPTTHFVFDLSGVPTLSNNAAVSFRLVDTSTTSISGGTVAAGGTSRVDNFTVATIPEPTTALLSAIGALALLRRRR